MRRCPVGKKSDLKVEWVCRVGNRNDLVKQSTNRSPAVTHSIPVPQSRLPWPCAVPEVWLKLLRPAVRVLS